MPASVLNSGPIVLVEDDADAVLFMRKAFNAAKITHPLREIKDGEELIAYLSGSAPFEDRQANPLPIMILLDLKLPNKSGFQLLEWIRKNPETSRLIVVVFSSSSAKKDIEQSYAMGANSYMVKPTAFHDLIEIVKMIKNYWLEHNQFPGRA